MRQSGGKAFRLPKERELPPAVRVNLFEALDGGPQAVALFDGEDRLAYANEAFRRGWSLAKPDSATFGSIMRSCHIRGQGAVVATGDIEGWLAKAEERRRFGPAFRGFEVDLHDGRWMWITERRLDDGWILLIGQDISPLKLSEQTMRAARDTAVQASLTDPLTQLANRRRALNRIKDLARDGKSFFLALIDIDHFKRINDSFGHAAGDKTLVRIAEALRNLPCRQCLPARLAGDEFALLSAPDQDRESFERLLRSFTDAVGSGGAGFGATPLTVSIGIAQAPEDGNDPSELLACADAAMYAVKTDGRAGWRHHEPAMGIRRREEAELLRDLPRAFERNEFVPFFQPIIDLRTKRTKQFEILARWQHPRLGLLAPDRFLGLMTTAPELTRLTSSLLWKAVRHAERWDIRLSFAFNIAAPQLSRHALLPLLEQVCLSGGVAPHRFEMEITEAALLQDHKEARAVVEAVRELGMSVALDDFGIGFSSLHHLREIRFDCVKIDRSFLANLQHSRNQRYLAALIHLVKELDLSVTVEGIETPELEAIVTELGGDFGQGSLYGKPMSALDAALRLIPEPTAA